MVDTFHTRTVHPAALSANGNDNKTPVTGPEWPVKVQIEVEDESEIFEKLAKVKMDFLQILVQNLWPEIHFEFDKKNLMVKSVQFTLTNASICSLNCQITIKCKDESIFFLEHTSDNRVNISSIDTLTL